MNPVWLQRLLLQAVTRMFWFSSCSWAAGKQRRNNLIKRDKADKDRGHGSLLKKPAAPAELIDPSHDQSSVLVLISLFFLHLFQDHCFYHGHVRGHPESWVALSTCSGVRYVLGNLHIVVAWIPSVSHQPQSWNFNLHISSCRFHFHAFILKVQDQKLWFCSSQFSCLRLILWNWTSDRCSTII